MNIFFLNTSFRYINTNSPVRVEAPKDMTSYDSVSPHGILYSMLYHQRPGNRNKVEVKRENENIKSLCSQSSYYICHIRHSKLECRNC